MGEGWGIIAVNEFLEGSGRCNARYHELLRRLKCVHTIPLRLVRGIRTLQRNFIGLLLFFVYARTYRVLFETGTKFIRYWPNYCIVDIDDPTFSADEIRALRKKNVICIVTTTKYLAEKLHHMTEKPIYVVPSGFSRRDIDSNIVANIRASLKGGRKVVGYHSPYLSLSNLDSDQHDLSLLISAMQLVWNYDRSVDLWLIGEPDQKLFCLAKEVPQVRLFGVVSRSNLLNLVSAFDVGVYPRRLDHGGRFSVKLIEYLGCGVPVVCNAVTESHIVRDAKAGFIAEGVSQFAEALLKLLYDEALRIEFSKNALAYSVNFDWDVIAHRYQEEVFYPIIGTQSASNL